MSNLEELKKKYKELGKEIERLEKEKSYKRWRAIDEDINVYYYIDEYGEITNDYDHEAKCDNFKYKTRNYFKTEEEAQRHLDNINTYYELMDLAEELNEGEKLNWNNYYQNKYSIYFDFDNKKICRAVNNMLKTLGQIYCLNKNFLEIALEKIGEDRLESLFKEE